MLVGHLERRTADDLRRLDRLLDHARPAVIPCARVLRTTGAPDLVIVRPHQVAAGFAAEPARQVEDVDCAAQPPVGRIDQAADDDAAVLVEHGCERRAARVGRQATVGLEAVGELAIDAATAPVLLDAKHTPYVPANPVEIGAMTTNA